jgi:outer membrane protein
VFRKLTAITLLLLAPVAAGADITINELSLFAWQQDIHARASRGGDVIDLDSSFDIDQTTDYQLSLGLDLPWRWLPNVTFQHTASEATGDGVVSATLFDRIELEGEVDGKLQLDHTDATVRFPVFESALHVDLGYTIRVFNAAVELTNSRGQTGDLDIDDVIPLLFSEARYTFGTSGFSAFANSRLVRLNDEKVVDLRAALRWQHVNGAGLEVGYRYLDIDYEIGGGLLEARPKGVYGGLVWTF